MDMIILPDKDQFIFKDCEIAGDSCWLITPNDMGVDWTDENSRFRSCIVRQSDNFVVSQGFRKFVNWGEKPAFEPWDETWDIEARHKIDGSLLIVSRYKGEWILRTRGTIDARQLANGHEIDLLIEKYSNFFKDVETQDSVSALGQTFLFEWTTPNNIIVLRESNEPELTLIGIVTNSDGFYYSQHYVDIVAKEYEFKRPTRYFYKSVSECIADVSAWVGKEGVVLYSPDGQTLKKIKAEEYLRLHRMATGITNINHVWEVFLASPRFIHPEEFFKYIETTMDFEIADKCREYIDTICEVYTKILERKKYLEQEVDKIRDMETRREQAFRILENKVSWEQSYMFLALDNRELPDTLLTKAFEYYKENEL